MKEKIISRTIESTKATVLFFNAEDKKMFPVEDVFSGKLSKEDVLKIARKEETESIKAWGGDTVLVVGTEHTDEFGVTLIEVTNPEVLKTVHGDDNVSGALSTGVTVNVNADELPESAWVIDMILHGVMKRIVIPKGKVTEVGEVTYADDDAVGYELTITALSGGFANSEDTHREYLKSI